MLTRHCRSSADAAGGDGMPEPILCFPTESELRALEFERQRARKRKFGFGIGLGILLVLGYALPGIAFKNTAMELPAPGLEPLYVPDAATLAKYDREYAGPPLNAPGTGNTPQIRTLILAKGDTIFSVFAKAGIDPAGAYPVIAACKGIYPIDSLPAGGQVTVESNGQDQFRHLSMDVSDRQSLDIGANRREIVVKLEPRAYKIRTFSAVVNLRKSLFEDGVAAGLPENIVKAVAAMFRYDLDLVKDIKPGDQLTVVYKGHVDARHRIRDGVVLAAEFLVNGVSHRLMRFQFPDGSIKYVDPGGKLSERAFIRTPVALSRITSRFSSARYHPILGQWRAHQGVDYAAPTGTPAIATANATVAVAAFNSTYGNYVILQYNPHISMLYAHLSAYAPGLRPGKKVKLGQVIGYVGQSGLATGPHLHYELRWDGIPRNPLTMPLPTADPLPPQFREAYLIQAGEYSALLDKLKYYHNLAMH